jgi:AcrR family transcriptional regulator
MTARSQLAPGTDPRPTRTRARLAASLNSLMRDGEAQPTVTSIVARAGVHRSSFYVHFESVDQLAVYVLRRQFAELSQVTGDALSRRDTTNRAAARSALRTTSLLIKRNARVLVAGRAAGDCVPMLAGLLSECISRHMAQRADPRPTEIRQAEQLFVSNGLAGLIASWIEGDLAIPIDRFVDRLVDQLPPSFDESWLPHAAVAGRRIGPAVDRHAGSLAADDTSSNSIPS